MLKTCVAEVGGRQVLLLDTITALTAEDRGAIVVTGSHGGSSSGAIALGYEPLLVVFNDAGCGKDDAGIVALGMFADREKPAAAVSHLSARIGEAADMWENGTISHANPKAAALGLRPGKRLCDVILGLDEESLTEDS